MSFCGSRSRAAQPVRRTPTVSRLCRPIGAFLLRSTSTMDKMHNNVIQILFSVTCSFYAIYMIIRTSKVLLFSAKLVSFAEADGNLSLPLVSKPERTRATSHPCERGAGLLEI